MTSNTQATIGTNATLLERMTYEPHNVKHEELLEALATLEEYQEITYQDHMYHFSTPADLTNYITTLEDGQITDGQEVELDDWSRLQALKTRRCYCADDVIAEFARLDEVIEELTAELQAARDTIANK